MKKKIVLLICIIMTMILFSGCEKGVELTEEEEGIISQYAASLLLKYDVNYANPLKEVQKESETDAQKESVEEDKAQNPEKNELEEPKQDASDESTPDESQNNKSSLTEVFGIDGIEVAYQGCIFTDSYPGEAVGGIRITAEDDKKLAILKFSVTNTTDQPKSCDILSGIPAFKATINGVSAPSIMTILLDDLSTTCEEISPGTVVEKVLICQVGKEVPETIEQLEILATYNKEVNTVNLVP